MKGPLNQVGTGGIKLRRWREDDGLEMMRDTWAQMALSVS